MWVYQCLDIISTLLEVFCLYVISLCLCKEPRFSPAVSKFIPPAVMMVLTAALTWFTALGAFKMPIIFLFAVVILKICYKDSILQSITAVEIWGIVFCFLTEAIALILSNWLYGNNQIVFVDGLSLVRWEIYAIGIAARLIIIGVIYLPIKNFKYKMQIKDSVILTLIFLMNFVITFLSVFSILSLGKALDLILYIGSIILSAAFMIIFMYAKNAIYLREQAQKNKIQLAQLQQQFAYYQNKQKDEEKIRSIYHDMKNHLLVLESSQGTDAVRNMAKQLRAQIAGYEDYIHTGSSFLDVIIKDKAEKMREKQIDFSVSIDFDGVDFIQPLDVSTLFGNGIDNAMEASEKLPKEQRVVLVKAGKVQSFVSVLIENNCIDEGLKAFLCTTKKDDFLHGFGISNMEKAAEKYGGTCTVKQENGTFTLKILIPIP